jgi:Fe-S cluster biogenesis protein NfuA
VSEEIKITGEFTPDPETVCFTVDRSIVDDWALDFQSREDSQGSPLVDAMFDVEGVAAIRVVGPKLMVRKDSPTPWMELAPTLGQVIRKVLGSGTPPISEAVLEAARTAPMPDLEPVITELFEQHINPALASHGGFVRLVKVEDRDVHLEMGGGCQGCASSQATLRYGIENAIREVAPQVRHVVDATDHASGENPYYT